MALAGRLFLPVFTHPGFPAFAGCRVAPGKGQCRDFGIRNSDSLVGITRQNANEGTLQRCASYAVKDIPINFAAIFLGDRHVATVIEGLLQRHAQIVFGSERRNPAFHAVVHGSWSHLKSFRVKFRVNFRIKGSVCRAVPVGMRWSAHARVSSSCVLLELICTRGLNACTGFAGSFSRANASESSYFPAKADLAAAQMPRSPLKV